MERGRSAWLVIARGNDTIVVTRAQFVVREVELERVNADCDADDDDRRSDDRSRENDCAELEIGPFLVDVPVTGATAGVLSVDIPEGTYDEVEFEIKKVSSSIDGDRAFRQAHPDFRDISLRIEGRDNGMPFVFVSAAEAEVELPLGAPLVVGRDGDRLTVSLDMGTWFVNPSGGLFQPGPGQHRWPRARAGAEEHQGQLPRPLRRSRRRLTARRGGRPPPAGPYGAMGVLTRADPVHVQRGRGVSASCAPCPHPW